MGTKILAMANPSFENERKGIHDSLGRLNQLVQDLAGRSRLERQQIRQKYKEMHGQDFVSRLQKTDQKVGNESVGVSPEICRALSMWLLEPCERDAVVIREALEQAGDTNYKALIEIFVGRKSSQIFLIKQAYHTRFRRQMDQDIIRIEPPHAYQRILVALAASHKAHHADVSKDIAKCDARRLYKTGEGSPGAVEEAVVLEVLSKRSIPQLKLTFSYYNHIYGRDYTKSLKQRNMGEFENALRTLVKCIRNPPNYYAKKLNASIKGLATDEGTLERVILSGSEVELDEVLRVYKMKYGTELRDAIWENVSNGDYRDFLLALI